MRLFEESPEARMTLNEELSFKEDGYIVIDNVLSYDEVETLLEATKNPSVTKAQNIRGFTEKTLHLMAITTYHPAFMELACHPKILDLVSSLLGKNIQLHHSKLATKPPAKGKGRFRWHQDFAFFPHTNFDLVAVMIMLDDSTSENGCLRAVRGSHRAGLLDHHKDGIFVAECQEQAYIQSDRIVDLMPCRGGISIHHCLTLHGSEPNQTGHSRRGLVFQYRADDAYQLAGTVFDDTGIVVAGVRSGVVRCEDSIWTLPKYRRTKSGYPFGTAWNQAGRIAKEQEIMMPKKR